MPQIADFIYRREGPWQKHVVVYQAINPGISCVQNQDCEWRGWKQIFSRLWMPNQEGEWKEESVEGGGGQWSRRDGERKEVVQTLFPS